MPIITHTEIAAFADQRVNLPAETAKKYRKQVSDLLDRLSLHITRNPGFAVVKMLHSGSVAKGTALKTVNDLDAAVYVKKNQAPRDDHELVPWIAQRLRESNPNMKFDQFDDKQPHCIEVHFEGSGLDVDVVPVLYEGAANDLGYLVDKYTGERLLTSIPLHLEFIRKRKNATPTHFAQVVRLLKWWAQQKKNADENFKCKSFMLELLVAHHADHGLDLSDYPKALEKIFAYITRTGLEERIFFEDYYPAKEIASQRVGAIEIFDPVNPKNNIAEKYSVSDREKLVQAATEAGDAIAEAHYATTKARAVECWQIVFGPSFQG
jgi:tRNA nucleotidyltransferase (CCA-adding enzyme)